MIEVIILTNIIHNQCSIFLFCFSICFSCSLISLTPLSILLFLLVTLALGIYRYLPLFFLVPHSIIYLQATAMAESYRKENARMNKDKALKAIESFKDSTNSVIYSPNSPATKGDINILKKQVAELAQKLVESISE